jgi:predicted alpha/beta superfamily hydrolase
MDADSATVQNPVPTTVLSLTSTQNGQEYRLFVSLPASYELSEQSYPTLYVLDGNGLFSMVRQIIEMVAIPSPRKVPELIIVGIGYPVSTYMDTLQLRGRDLTYEQFTPEPDNAYPWGETGGGMTFLKVLNEEILPFIDRKYRTNTQDRGLIGWSLGGGFAHRAIYLHPGLFSRVVNIDGYDKEAECFAQQPGQAAPTKHLFIGFSSISINPDDTAMLNSHIEAVKASGVQAKGHIFEGETHFSVVPSVISRGLREVYAEP